MSRSLTKGPFIAYHLLKKLEILNQKKKKEVNKNIFENKKGVDILFSLRNTELEI